MGDTWHTTQALRSSASAVTALSASGMVGGSRLGPRLRTLVGLDCVQDLDSCGELEGDRNAHDVD